MNAKVVQDNGKALTSNPNSELGNWLLRDVLGLKEKEILTYEKLEAIGLDSVVINKVNDKNYEINFAKIGSFEQFIGESLLSDEDIDEQDNAD